jgi:hypothetical protein
MLAELFEKIKGFISGQRQTWNIALPIVPLAADLEFLYWLRDLLINLKQAVLNFEFCVDYTFFNGDIGGRAGDIDGVTVTAGPDVNIEDVLNPKINLNDPSRAQPYTIGDNRDILVDKDKMFGGNWVSQVSNGFLREFIHQQYGIPYEVIDNTITRGTAEDSIQGTNITSGNNFLMDRCANTPTAQEALRWVLNIQSRN